MLRRVVSASRWTPVVWLAFLGGCEPAEDLEYAAASVASWVSVSDTVAPDSTIESLIRPYRNRFESRLGEVVATAEEPLVRGSGPGGWEGGLENFTADAMLAVANRVHDGRVEMSITNASGLRAPLPAGSVTIGDFYRLMPFENALTILELTGEQLLELMTRVATRPNQVAVAGIRVLVDPESQSIDFVTVSGTELEAERTYRIVTIDFLANGGSSWPVLPDASRRIDLEFDLRSAFIDHARALGTLKAVHDGRIAPVEVSN